MTLLPIISMFSCILHDYWSQLNFLHILVQQDKLLKLFQNNKECHRQSIASCCCLKYIKYLPFNNFNKDLKLEFIFFLICVIFSACLSYFNEVTHNAKFEFSFTVFYCSSLIYKFNELSCKDLLIFSFPAQPFIIQNVYRH